MAKMRVYELAKELNIGSKEIFDALDSTKYKVENRNAATNLNEEAQEIVRGRYGKAKEEQKPQEEKPVRQANFVTYTAKKPKDAGAGGNSANAGNAAGNSAQRQRPRDAGRPGGQQGVRRDGGTGQDAPKKKSGISTIYNSQYSNGQGGSGQRRGGNGNGGNNGGNGNAGNAGRNRNRRDAGNNNAGRPQQHAIIRPRPVGERTMRPIGERTTSWEDELKNETQTQNVTANDHTQSTQQPDIADVAVNAQTAGSTAAPQMPDQTAHTQGVGTNAAADSKPVAAPIDTAQVKQAAAGDAVQSQTAAQPQQREQTLSGGGKILGNIFTNAPAQSTDSVEGSSEQRTRSRRRRSSAQAGGSGQGAEGEHRQGTNGERRNTAQGAGGERRRDSAQAGNGERRNSSQGAGGERRQGAQAANGERRQGAQTTGGDRRNGSQGQNNDRRRDASQGANGERRRDGAQGVGGDRRNGAQGAGGERRQGAQGDRYGRSTAGMNGQGADRRNDRSGMQGAGGDRRRDGGMATGRPGGNAGGRDRFEKGRNGFDKESGASDEMRGKESRDRGAAKRGNNNNRHRDHDQLGSKRQENMTSLEKHGDRKKKQPAPQPVKEAADEIRTITVPEKLTIRELADLMKMQPAVIIKKLFLQGEMVTVNSELTYEAAEEIALEYNVICEPEEKVDVIAELMKDEEEDPKDLVPRPPVVCVMGHVDHGKTSLLDAIRSTRVTDREAGGITQHIGASVVSINGQQITFLDTPGHEAFTAMRMRGANSTDIAVLVIAADDGVMPQTIEAINHAKAAGVEIIVAINKIDKVGANPERVKQELTEYELVPEEWGGSTVFCEVSAKTKEGLDNLLEMILLTAEVLELRANPNRKARGLVIEAQLDKGRGAVATMLVQKGTLHVGDTLACGSCYGRVRAMIDDQGRRVTEAGPSMPVEIQGLSGVPMAGEIFKATDSEREAKEIAEAYINEEKSRLIEETKAKMSLDDLFSEIQSGNMKELDLIVKADVQGSVEAVKTSLTKLSNDEVVVKVIHSGAGAINESDIILASASNAIIIGFNVKLDPNAKQMADSEGVDVRLYNVIYNAISDVELAMKGMLDPIFEERVIGHLEIRQIFKASGVGNIAGSYVTDGTIERGCKVRIYREGKQIFEGDLASLKRFKDDVREVRAGYECGLVFAGFNDIQELDTVEAYKMVEVPRV